MGEGCSRRTQNCWQAIEMGSDVSCCDDRCGGKEVASPKDSEKKIEKKEGGTTGETGSKAEEDSNRNGSPLSQPPDAPARDGSPIKGKLGSRSDVANKGEKDENPKADANVEQDNTKKAADQVTTNGQADKGATQGTAGESQAVITTAGDVEMTSEETQNAEKLQRKRRKSADAGINNVTARGREHRINTAAHSQAWDFKENEDVWWNEADNGMGPAVMTTKMLNKIYPTGSEVYSVTYMQKTYVNKSNKQEAVVEILNALGAAREAREAVKLQLLDPTAVEELSKQKVHRVNSNPHTRENTPANSVTPASSVAPVQSPAPTN